MQMGIENRTALVAGGSQGLGLAVARGLAAEGCNLAICARGKDALEAAADGISKDFKVEVFWQAVDLNDGEAAARFATQVMEKFGSLDILINNAGGPPAGGFAENDESVWRRAIDLTLFSALTLTRTALPSMRANKWGRIINMTSVSVKQPVAGLMLSNSVRAALVSWGKALADEVAGDNITVNNVMPGWMLTKRVDELLEHRSQTLGISKEQAAEQVVAGIPLGRMGKPEEFGALVVFLASEPASYITGVSYLIDGGLHRGMM